MLVDSAKSVVVLLVRQVHHSVAEQAVPDILAPPRPTALGRLLVALEDLATPPAPAAREVAELAIQVEQVDQPVEEMERVDY